MKRTGFKPKKTEKRIIAEYRKTPKKGWVAPKWIGAIPQGSHGTGKIQKKAWKVVSDFVRIKDFHLHGSICFGCKENKIHHWKDGQAGHWKSWGYSNSYAKYEIRNLLMICANCNTNEDGLVGYRIGEQLNKMYGKKNEDYIIEQNNAYRGKKMEEIVLVEMIEMYIRAMKDLPEQPDYYQKVIEQL